MSALLATEFLKVRTLRITYLVPVVVLVLVVVLTVLDSAFDPPEHNGELGDFMDVGLAICAAAVAAAAAGLVGSEFARRTIAFDFLAVPRRIPVLAAKLLCFAILGALLGLLASVVAHVVAAPLAIGHDVPVGAGSDIITRIGAVTAATAILGTIGASLGTIVRSPAVAVVAIAVWQPVESLVGGLMGIGDFLPFGLMAAVVQLGTDQIATLPAVAVLGAYAAAGACLAWLLAGRDLT